MALTNRWLAVGLVLLGSSGLGCGRTDLALTASAGASGDPSQWPIADAAIAGCGDGILQGAEECDEGTENSDGDYGGCSTHCHYLGCGDGIVNGPEECDLGFGRNTAVYGDPTGHSEADDCADVFPDVARHRTEVKSEADTRS